MITLDSHFEGGNIEKVRQTGLNRFACQSRKATSKNALWFYFRIRGAKGRRITICLENAHDVWNKESQIDYPKSWPAARPVYFHDNQTFCRVKRGTYDQSKGTFTFAVPCTENEVFVAFSYPYVYSDLQAFLKKIRGNPNVRIQTLAKSRQGLDVPLITIQGKPRRPKRDVVWIFARQHAGETPGSFAVEGLCDYVLSNSRGAEFLQKNAILKIIPMFDVDNVAAGNYGKDSLPVDFNRDWKKNSIRPEIRAARRLIQKSAQEGRIALFLDLHAPGLAQGNDFNDCSLCEPTDPNYPEKRSLFMKDLEAFAPRQNPYHYTTQFSSGGRIEGMAHRYFHQKYGCLALTLELSYHRAIRNRNLYVTAHSIRAYGQAIGKTIFRHLASLSQKQF
ncbi:MAG: M14-type cytosolic carboxypeptidase [Verrucomicrobiae bacterium]|nr:M14-type cytosolic carboxypeptidase [Verrucomicrobiae bacterium]